tara:strand:+ start:13 stop:237 length:225 start_codon:yes stop_codon:yes gene_type:complete
MTLLLLTLMACTACSELALMGSLGGMAASQNTYTKIYSGVDFTTLTLTEKSVKEHIYEKGKQYINDQTMGFVKK